MTKGGRFYGFANCFYNILRCPAALIRLALGRASFPRGKLLYRVGRHTGYFLRRDNRKVPGTAHRPFPAVFLEGGTVQPYGVYSERGMVVLRAANQNLLIAGGNHTLIPSMNHRRYIAWFHSTTQVEFATWRAADCRPYGLVGA